MTDKWDAEKYKTNFSFIHNYGNDLFNLIELDKCQFILDLGCGNGELTKKFYDKGINAFGIDSSDEMLEIAERSYPELNFYKSDAVDFDIAEKVDAVFSNAVFHWISEKNQNKMLKCVYNALKKNGQFVFEMGGKGNNALIHDMLSRVFKIKVYDYNLPFYFPSIGEYTSLLEKAGFKVVYAVLFDRLTELSGENGLYDWIKMFIKKPFENITDSCCDEIINETVIGLKNELYSDGVWYADYVRFRCKSIKVE